MSAWSYVVSLVRRPDIVFTRDPILAKEASHLNIPVVLELHSLPEHTSKMSRALERLIRSPHLRRIICISGSLANDLVEHYPIERHDIEVLVAHDGASSTSFSDPVQPENHPIRIGYFGHLYPGKGAETISMIAPRLPELRFEIFGGREEDIERWRSQTERIDNLTFHGHIAHDKVASEMSKCDVLIAPYRSSVSHIGGGDISGWMSPLKLFEYMAAERPVVTSRLPALEEVVSSGNNGVLCDPEDPQDWVRALDSLSKDGKLRKRLARNARQDFEQNYTWQARAEKVLAGI